MVEWIALIDLIYFIQKYLRFIFFSQIEIRELINPANC